MKVVCFGDSNTWGHDPKDGTRQEKRWTRLLQEVHPDWEIVEEGLNGRTLAMDDPFSLPRNGAKQISDVIRSHMPYDVLVVMLGTNDAKEIYGLNGHWLERCLYRFLENATAPELFRRMPYEPGKILLVQPPKARWKEGSVLGESGTELMETCQDIYQKAADLFGIDFLPTDVRAGETDGLHLEAEGHERMAEVIGNKLEKMTCTS